MSAPKPISARWANLLGLRYMLDRYGYDPCDSVCVEAFMGLPPGLRYSAGQVQFQCRSCEQWTQLPVDPSEYWEEDPNNLCGGSPRCCP